jgi:hypothetical protein
LPFSIISSSWSVARTASQDQVEKRPDLYHEVRRKPLPTTASPLYEPPLATERFAKRRRNRRRPDDAAAQVASIRAAHLPGRVERGRKLVENRDRKEGGKVITERPLLTVRRGFPRPTASSVRRFADAATVHLVDAMDGRGALDHEIKAVDPASSVFAAALTCHAGADDTLAILAAFTLAQPGDVIVAATEDFRGSAVVGNLFAAIAKTAGVVAIVTDGLARDSAGIAEVGVPVLPAVSPPTLRLVRGPGPWACPSRSAACGSRRAT